MVNKSSNIKDRVLQIVEYKGVTKESFFKKINMSYGNFKGKSKNTPLNSNAVADISTIYPDINLEWLITGKGEMLKKDGSSQPKDPSLKEVLDRLEERGNELALLKRDYDALRKENEYLKKELQAKRIHTPKHE